MKQNTKHTKYVLHPQAQVLVTGKPVSVEQAREIIEFTETLSLRNWCGVNGNIGHIDSIQSNVTYERLLEDLHSLVSRFPYLDLGISVMSGPPGSFTMPLTSIQIKGGILQEKVSDIHLQHPAPKRVHIKKTN